MGEAFMSAVARDVGRGQERLAVFRVARCQNGDHSVAGQVFTSARGTALYDSNI